MTDAEELLLAWYEWWRADNSAPRKMPDALHVKTAAYFVVHGVPFTAPNGLPFEGVSLSKLNALARDSLYVRMRDRVGAWCLCYVRRRHHEKLGSRGRCYRCGKKMRGEAK